MAIAYESLVRIPALGMASCLLFALVKGLSGCMSGSDSVSMMTQKGCWPLGY